MAVVEFQLLCNWLTQMNGQACLLCRFIPLDSAKSIRSNKICVSFHATGYGKIDEMKHRSGQTKNRISLLFPGRVNFFPLPSDHNHGKYQLIHFFYSNFSNSSCRLNTVQGRIYTALLISLRPYLKVSFILISITFHISYK